MSVEGGKEGRKPIILDDGVSKDQRSGVWVPVRAGFLKSRAGVDKQQGGREGSNKGSARQGRGTNLTAKRRAKKAVSGRWQLYTQAIGVRSRLPFGIENRDLFWRGREGEGLVGTTSSPRAS